MTNPVGANKPLFALVAKTLQPLQEEAPSIHNDAGLALTHLHDDPDFHTVHHETHLVVGRIQSHPAGGARHVEIGRHKIGEQIHTRKEGESAHDFDVRVSNHIDDSHNVYDETKDEGPGTNHPHNGLDGHITGFHLDGIRQAHKDAGKKYGEGPVVTGSMTQHHFLSKPGDNFKNPDWHRDASYKNTDGVHTHIEHLVTVKP